MGFWDNICCRRGKLQKCENASSISVQICSCSAAAAAAAWEEKRFIKKSGDEVVVVVLLFNRPQLHK
jgi:hypothetical protein